MTDKPFFLHFEGMDLAGKSSLARNFARHSELSWEINDKRLTKINPVYDFAWEIGKKKIIDSTSLGYLYLSALFEDIRNFKLEGNIIQDSTLLLRSMNYYKTIGNNPDLVKSFAEIAPRHPIPDKSFYLTADIDVRRSRLDKRIKEMPTKLTSNDLMIRDNPDKFIKIDESLKELSIKYFNSQVIDTSNMSEMDVVEEIKSFCRNY